MVRSVFKHGDFQWLLKKRDWEEVEPVWRMENDGVVHVQQCPVSRTISRLDP
jgi:hypothetical protein